MPLTLHLHPTPLPITVECRPRRDHQAPVRCRIGREPWSAVAQALGPERVSGGQWEAEPYAREYFRVLTEDGALLWLFRDARADEWYQHGWWD